MKMLEFSEGKENNELMLKSHITMMIESLANVGSNKQRDKAEQGLHHMQLASAHETNCYGIYAIDYRVLCHTTRH